MKYDKYHGICHWTLLYFDVKTNPVQDNSDQTQSLLIRFKYDYSFKYDDQQLWSCSEHYKVTKNIIYQFGWNLFDEMGPFP